MKRALAPCLGGLVVLVLLSLGCATTRLEDGLGELQRESAAQQQRLDQLSMDIKASETRVAEAKREADQEECVAAKQRIRAEVAGTQAECAQSHAQYSGCTAANAERRSRVAVGGCLLGGLLTGGIGLFACGAGVLLGHATEQACTKPDCPIDIEKAQEVILARHGLSKLPHCGGWLGAGLKNQSVDKVVVLTKVEAGSPAETVGLRVNDYLLAVGQCSGPAFMERRCVAPAGQPVRLDVVRENSRLSQDIVLPPRPDGTGGHLGVDGEVAPFAVVASLGVDVESVKPESAAAAAGLQPGDRIVALSAQPAWTRAEVYERIDMLAPGARLDLTIVRNHATMNIPVVLKEWPHE